MYKQVDNLKSKLDIVNIFPIFSKTLAQNYTKNPIIEELPFPSNKICGILYKGDTSTSFALNSGRTPEMRNFDCMHELIHYFFHDIKQCQRICCDEQRNGGRIEQDTYIEWQANEGAAQFLVPYQTFIPDYIRESQLHARDPLLTRDDICKILAPRYFVSPKVISNRIDSLNYEIYQFLHGTPIFEIVPLSKTKLKDIGWSLTHEKTYCRTCCSPIGKDHNFCQVCGVQLDDGHALHKLGKINRGAGYMTYQGVELKESGQVKECPQCKNEEHLKDANFCMICGKPVINRCTFAIDENVSSAYIQCSHDEPLPGNARFCPYCGCKTTFYANGVLSAYNSDDLPF